MATPKLRWIGLFAVALVGLLARPASAYDRYSVSGNSTNCRACHGDFRATTYTSLVDGQSWGNLHNLHRYTMLNGDCNTCHSGTSRFPVLTNSSTGGTSLPAISCIGCHGRAADNTTANPEVVAGRSGYGAGLRQHHNRAGVTVCATCHQDANPANYTPVGENVLPAYYGQSVAGHPAMPLDSCNADGSEDFAGATYALDNDGDDLWDGADPNCAVPVCGDSIVSGSETCDDGDAVGGDGCSATCQTEAGWTCATPGAACTSTCGDSVIAVGAETCDDGDAAGGDGCSATCQTEAGWTCATPGAACTSTCGDGVIAAGAEECDDGDAAGGDGCSAACAVEAGYACTGEPSVCVLTCGDGVIDAGEECDDGGVADGDGCSAACAVEAGYACTGEPSTCVQSCGDGVIDAGEACDDGGVADGDGCSASCAVEAGYTCTGEPSVCTPDGGAACGDGAIDGNEACDDGGTAGGDGCSATCTVEVGYTCTGEPSDCIADGGAADGGCCDAGGTADQGGALALGLLVMLGVRRRR